ncbi:hypothetical protein [Corynebacterium striatum]|uniref:hypothetical protein n=1 Tax=Corynebacterium striatum TaxID=43770 RepID=UPI0027BA06F5|nr:hypothetical protein [Corynebacterium striatum]
MKVPYHSHTNPEDEIAQAAAQIRHAELRFWCEHLPEFDNDIELAVQRMFSATGVSPARISKIFMALDRLESMPELHALQERYLHLDLDRLIAINESLDKLGNRFPAPSPASTLASPSTSHQSVRTKSRPRKQISSANSMSSLAPKMTRLPCKIRAAVVDTAPTHSP